MTPVPVSESAGNVTRNCRREVREGGRLVAAGGRKSSASSRATRSSFDPAHAGYHSCHLAARPGRAASGPTGAASLLARCSLKLQNVIDMSPVSRQRAGRPDKQTPPVVRS